MKLTEEDIAQVVHEAIRGYQRVLGEMVVFPWENTSYEMRESTLDGVRMALNDGDPVANHENWVRTRLDQGWTLGPVKDFGRKEHPLLVPYDELPEEQKAKDALVIAISQALEPLL